MTAALIALGWIVLGVLVWAVVRGGTIEPTPRDPRRSP